MESRIERLCIERGLKMTGQRRVIARVLSDATDHPDVEELYRRAAALDSHISIATVYRTVRLLEENGILERRDFGGGRARYEPTEHGNHYHLIDIETGKVIEFQDAEHERLMQTLQRAWASNWSRCASNCSAGEPRPCPADRPSPGASPGPGARPRPRTAAIRRNPPCRRNQQPRCRAMPGNAPRHRSTAVPAIRPGEG